MLILSTPVGLVQKFMYNPMLKPEQLTTQEKAAVAIKNLPLTYTKNLCPSLFNYAEHGNNIHAIHNTLFCSTVLLNDKEWELLQAPEKGGDEETLRKLYNAGFLVPKRINEFAKLEKFKRKFFRFLKQNSILKLVIATTTKCNARCDYCFECNTARSDMTPKVEKDITKFIDKRIGKNRKLSIAWFGGEPLLNTGLIDRISQYCSAKKYELNAILVTNGSLLNEEMLRDSFPKWKTRNIDITLDGTAQEYARIKNYLAPELGNLERILSNIELATKYKIHVRIRLNVNKKNADDLLILTEQLKQRFEGNKYVTWYMAPLLNTGADFATEEEWITLLEKYISLSPYKMNLSYSRMLPKIGYCLAERSYSYGIDVNGDIKICGTHFTDNSKSIGNIQNFDCRKDKRRRYPKLLPKCEKCCWLPICDGGCVTRHIHNAMACTPKKYFLIATLRQLIR